MSAREEERRVEARLIITFLRRDSLHQEAQYALHMGKATLHWGQCRRAGE
jgi:hypothetical protein